MTYKQVCDINDNQIILNLPPEFKGKKQVVVTVDDSVETKKQKLKLLENASKDPLFLSDINEINLDFDFIDQEIHD